METRFLTVRDVAELLRLHPQTVRGWCRTGELPAVLIADRTGYRIPEQGLVKFLERRQHLHRGRTAA